MGMEDGGCICALVDEDGLYGLWVLTGWRRRCLHERQTHSGTSPVLSSRGILLCYYQHFWQKELQSSRF